jgi:hypothetical protein
LIFKGKIMGVAVTPQKGERFNPLDSEPIPAQAFASTGISRLQPPTSRCRAMVAPFNWHQAIKPYIKLYLELLRASTVVSLRY